GEVVVVEVVLLGLEPEGVETHLLLERAQRGDRDGLRLATREQRRAVRARQEPSLDGDRADLLLGAAVRALLLDGDALADDRLLETVEGQLGLGAVPGVLRRVDRARVLLEHLLLDGLGRVLALALLD